MVVVDLALLVGGLEALQVAVREQVIPHLAKVFGQVDTDPLLAGTARDLQVSEPPPAAVVEAEVGPQGAHPYRPQALAESHRQQGTKPGIYVVFRVAHRCRDELQLLLAVAGTETVISSSACFFQ